MTAAALDSSQITKLGVGIIVGLVVVGLVLSMVITAIVGRILILAVVVVLGVVVWQQRTSLKDDVAQCRLDRTFFGVHISAPANVVAACQRQQQTR